MAVQPDELPKHYAYRPRKSLPLMTTLFFSLCAVVLGYVAATNQKGKVIFDGAWKLSKTGATYFYWALAAASLAFVVMGLLLLIASLRSTELVIAHDHILVPKRFLGKGHKRVSLERLLEYKMVKTSGQQWLQLRTKEGRTLIQASWLASDEAFLELEKLIRQQRNLLSQR